MHSFEVVATDPYIVFPGNIQGRKVRETGAKGAVIVEVVERTVVSVEPIEIDVIRWASVCVDCINADRDTVVSRMRDCLTEAHARNTGGRPLIVRLALTGTSDLSARLREDALSLRDDARAVAAAISTDLWIEKVQIRARDAVNQVDGHLPGDLASLIEEAVTSEDFATELAKDLDTFLSAAKASLGEAGDEDELRHAAGMTKGRCSCSGSHIEIDPLISPPR